MTQPIHPMLERVARAMATANYPRASASDIDEMWDTWLLDARAAIQALLEAETTYDMYDAGDEFVGAHGDAGDADKVFKAMLKPLLGDEG